MIENISGKTDAKLSPTSAMEAMATYWFPNMIPQTENTDAVAVNTKNVSALR